MRLFRRVIARPAQGRTVRVPRIRALLQGRRGRRLCHRGAVFTDAVRTSRPRVPRV